MPEMPMDVGPVSVLPAGWKPAQRPPHDSSRSALELIHRLLIPPAEEPAERSGLLDELAAAVAATAAGTAAFSEGASWVGQLDRRLRRQRMEAAARIVRRLAHDFGNILTGILGFSELALSQQGGPDSSMHLFLTEIHRGAQSGAQYTERLRLFARQETSTKRTCRLADVLGEWKSENVQLKRHLPADLPAVAVEPEALRQVLTIVLDNARESIPGPGVIEISARTVQVEAREAGELFGDVRPGTHLEIRIADNGSGLTPEAQRLLFAEPFFSTKSRKRGFGLATAYGILSGHRGGLELLSRPEGGTIARLIVPVAAVAAPSL